MWRTWCVVGLLVLSGCSVTDDEYVSPSKTWWYQLSGYNGDAIHDIADSDVDTVVIDLATNGGNDYWSSDDLDLLHQNGKSVYAYFSIGTIETYRPEYDDVIAAALTANRWNDWPDEYFVTFWDDQWWELSVRPRIDHAIDIGFDGAYLDVLNAYEDIDLDAAPGWSRDDLAAAMVDQLIRVSEYAKQRQSSFRIYPQNSPELRLYNGYLDAIDGIGVEELYYQDTNHPCTATWCGENLAHVRALRDAGKEILAVDYATDADKITASCHSHAHEHFVSTIATVELDQPPTSCEL